MSAPVGVPSVPSVPLAVSGGPVTGIAVDIGDVWDTGCAFDVFARQLDECVDAIVHDIATANAHALYGAPTPDGAVLMSQVTTTVWHLRDAYDTITTIVQRVKQSATLYAHVDATADGDLLGHVFSGVVHLIRAAGDLATLDLHGAGTQLMDAAPDVTDALAPLFYDLEQRIGALPDDGRPVVHDLGTDRDAAAAPHTLGDLITGLSHRNQGHHGEVSVTFVVGDDGVRRAIVDIPGTKSWNPVPTGDVTNVWTDARAVGGADTSFEQGVAIAMRRAGVTSTTPVLLVGHSLGGLVAVNLARRATASKQFTITHVLTAGAPIGRVAGSLPASVQVLALENSADIVPASDGAANPARSNVTTVQGRYQTGSVTGNHDLAATYTTEARDADDSGNAEVDAFVHSAQGYLSATGAATTAYWVTRGV